MDPNALGALIQSLRSLTGGTAPGSAMGGLPNGVVPTQDASPAGTPPYYVASPSTPLSYMMAGSPLNDPNAAANAAAAQRVQALISGIEMTPNPTPPPKRSTGNKILGALGDALTNYGSVRAGGPAIPQGPYGTALQRERLRFQDASEEAAKNNAAIRNQMRLAAFQKDEDRIRATDEARIRSTGFNRGLRPMAESQTLDINGTPTMVTILRDPQTRETFDVQIGGFSVMDDPDLMEQIRRGYKGFAPSAGVPVVTVGANGDRQVTLANIGKGPNATVRPLKTAGGAATEPQPPAGYAQDMGATQGALGGLPAVMKAYDTADTAAKKRREGGLLPESVDRGLNFVDAKIGSSEYGELLSPDETVKYYSDAKAVLTPYIRAASGLTVPEKEYKRYESRFPKPGVASREVAAEKWKSIIGEMVRDMRARARQMGRTPPPLPDELKYVEDDPGDAGNDPRARAKKILEDIDKGRASGASAP